MTDDLTPEATSELASGYLDDELTADDRALVEHDDALLAEVDRIRQVRALLGDVEPPLISVREEHLAAALDAWDRLPEAERAGTGRDGTPRRLSRDSTPAAGAVAAGAASITTPRRADRRRSWSTAWMGAAAAAMLVVAGAAVVIQGTGGSDDDSADDAGVLESAADTASSDGAGTEAESSLSDEEARDATAALGELAGGDQSDAAEIVAENLPESSLDTGIDTPAPPIDVPLEEIDGTEQLAIFASDALGAPTAPDTATDGEADATEEGSLFDLRQCGTVDVLVGPASYRGQPVVVGIDSGRDLAFAHDLVDCTEVARVRLP